MSTNLALARARDLAQLCEEAALPSPGRHARADTLFETTSSKELVRLLDRALVRSASAEAVRHGVAATLAIDALNDRRPVSALERRRIDEVVAKALARSDIEPVQKALALAARARVRLQLGEADLALADADCAASLVEEAGGSSAARAFVAARRGYALAMLARTEEALAAHGVSAEHAEASGDVRAHVSALQDEGNILQQLGRVAESRQRFELSLERAVAAADRAGEMRAHAGLAYQHLDALRFADARDAYAAAMVIGETGVAPRLRALVMGYSAMLHLEHGHIERAVALAARAVAESAKLGFRVGEGFFAAVQSAAHARSGDFDAADDRIRFAKGRVPPDHAYVHVVRLFEAQVAVERAYSSVPGHASAGDAALADARRLLDEVSRARPGEPKALTERLDDARGAARILRGRLEREHAPRREEERDRPEVRDETGALTRRLDVRRLLSHLRARPGKVVRARELARHVWPGGELDEPAARARLDALIASEEATLLGCAVRAEANGYVLAIAP